jgi:hypothetical protein
MMPRKTRKKMKLKQRKRKEMMQHKQRKILKKQSKHLQMPRTGERSFQHSFRANLERLAHLML